MINTQTNYMENLYTEGFVVTTPQPFQIEVSQGSLNFIHEVKKEIIVDKTSSDGTIRKVTDYEKVEEIDKEEYPSFSFDVEPDVLLDVEYVVYLLKQPSKSGDLIYLTRTELDDGIFPIYDGEDEKIYTLMRVNVPAGTTDLEDADIKIRQVVRTDANSNSEQ